jgi:FtsZ-interacting cell division protein YlmF
VNSVNGWWTNIKESILRFYEEEDYIPSEKRLKNRRIEDEFLSKEAQRIPPHEKPSQIAVCAPEDPDEEWRPADYIKTERPVIVNFKKLHGDDRAQVKNFLLGVIYALEGTYTKLSDDLIIFAPRDVGIITRHTSQSPMLEKEFFSGDLNPEDFL